VKISAKPVDIVIMQVYMAKMDYGDEEIEKMYNISDILHQGGRDQVNARVMGGFDSMMGEGSTNKMVGVFRLSRRNERAKMLIKAGNTMVVMNT
jgi:hypothetical protein